MLLFGKKQMVFLRFKSLLLQLSLCFKRIPNGIPRLGIHLFDLQEELRHGSAMGNLFVRTQFHLLLVICQSGILDDFGLTLHT